MIHKFFLCLASAFVVSAALLAIYAWRQMGASPSKEELQQYASLPYFKNGRFVSPTDISVYPERMPGGKKAMLEIFLPGRNKPASPIPQQRLFADSFSVIPSNLAVYWLGHSSLIIELAGKRFLVDPVFDNAAPIPGLFSRYVKAPLQRADIPPVDYILITHNHYDHLEAATIRFLKKRNALFIVPLGVGAALRSWGVPAQNIREMAWGDTLQEGSVQITARPAGHYSARGLGDKNKTLWLAYILKGADKTLYISGDTGYKENLHTAVGLQDGPFDAAFIEIDAWNEGWPGMHLFPHQAVQLAKDIRARELIPVHWGVFNLGGHPWDESIRLVSEEARNQGVRLGTPLMGQKYEPGNTQTEPWWESLSHRPQKNDDGK